MVKEVETSVSQYYGLFVMDFCTQLVLGTLLLLVTLYLIFKSYKYKITGLIVMLECLLLMGEVFQLMEASLNFRTVNLIK